MECERSGCHEQAVARVPVLGIMRHVCEEHGRKRSDDNHRLTSSRGFYDNPFEGVQSYGTQKV